MQLGWLYRRLTPGKARRKNAVENRRKNVERHCYPIQLESKWNTENFDAEEPQFEQKTNQ